jgi:hypothetical protein
MLCIRQARSTKAPALKEDVEKVRECLVSKTLSAAVAALSHLAPHQRVRREEQVRPQPASFFLVLHSKYE